MHSGVTLVATRRDLPNRHPGRTGDPVPVRAGRAGDPGRRRRFRAGALSLATGALGLFTLTGCGEQPAPAQPPPAQPTASPATASAKAPEARDRLAAFAAAAEDRRFTAAYTLRVPGWPDRTVTVTRATDGSWRLDVPGGALGGTVDVALIRNRDGLLQCTLPSVLDPAPARCVRLGDPGGPLPEAVDPRVQHPFLDWPRVLTDRQAPLVVSGVPSPPGLNGECFAVDSTSASLRPPLDVGTYCYAPDGTLTSARLEYGTLILSGAPAAPPPTVSLPGPLTDGEPLPVGPRDGG